MEYKSYEKQKENFDQLATNYFVKRIFDSIADADSTREDITDSVGNILINEPAPKSKWAFTHFDKLILSLKASLGEKYLQNLLQHYKYIEELDPLFIMNMDKNTDIKNVRKHLGLIITKMEDVSYLPMGVEHDEEHIEDDEEETVSDKVSESLTIATLLFYTYRNDRIPTEIDFNANVCTSVEMTFNIRAYKNFAECKEFCLKNKLINVTSITRDGIRKMKSIAECAYDGNILANTKNMIEDQSHNWEKIAKLRR